MTFIIAILNESYALLFEMAPYLVFGFLVAGILHIFFSTETVAKHLGQNNLTSVVKASLFGIPLPLCSCGVIPAALSLKKEGASKGAVLSFLVSTPTTGIDSICATYALLGGLFAVYRVIAAFVGSFVVGVLANVLLPIEEREIKKEATACKLCATGCEHEGHHSFIEKIKGVFVYGFVTLMRDAGGWLVLGILLGGVIAYVIPEELIRSYIGSGVTAIVVMMLVGIPMYICSAGSIPIAAALMMKGLNPGAAFAFLFSGPATNTVTMVAIGKHLGKGALLVYVATLFAVSIGLGVCFDFMWQYFGLPTFSEMHLHGEMVPLWLKQGSAFLILSLICIEKIFSKLNKKTHAHG